MTAQRPRITLARLQQAADSGELFLVYQPKLDLRTDMITGAEGLARWQHPRCGSICPSDFIPATERSGFIDWFTEWALKVAVRQWSAWRNEELDLDLAVNISALNLEHVGFPDLVSAICMEAGMPCEQLILELTEGATQDAIRLMDTVSRFRLKGFGISLDDFGTGYGSLVQLRGLPFTELKIDQRFVSDLLISKDSRAITRGLIAIAHDIGLIVTAEGVEDLATLDLLKTYQCDMAQGFAIGRAMTGDLLSAWAKNRRVATPRN